MRVHEAVGVEGEPEARHGSQEEQEEQAPVSVCPEEHSLVHGVRRDVEIAVWEISAADTGHAATVGTVTGFEPRPRPFRLTSGTAP
jgi:hypothetical protein